MKNIILLIIVVVILGGVYWVYRDSMNKRGQTPAATPSNIAIATPTPTSMVTPAPTNALDFPIAQFKERITKKPFGIYITPATSPVQPERFSGYHTGADVEYEDVTIDVPVYAVADGTVVLARTASGYGGVMIIEVQINGVKHSVLYGHIRPSSMPSVGQQVKKGEQIGVLGTGYSSETDNERRHLHFSILSNNRADLKGYVQSQAELSGWIDPVSLYEITNSK